MDRKSEMVLAVIMMGFFAAFILRLPDAPIANLKTNTDIFSTYIATNMVPNADGTNAPVYADVNALTDIAPAAGDTTPAATDTPSTNTPSTTGNVAPKIDGKADDAKTDASVKQPAAVVTEDTKTDEKAEDETAPILETPSEKPAQ